MKHSLLFALIFLSALSLSAAPGDTTWVQAHNDKRLDQWAANFDSTVTFPDGSVSYRKIIMVFTLGKYVCGVTPCSDWDYTVQTKIMTPGGDTLELGRLITPYANSARMTANWRGVYNFDVTDYYHQLKNTATVRVHYSGYSGGFTANVKFAFIEGTRPRDVVGITPIWKNSYNYGHGPVAINNALANVNLTAPSGTVSAESKFTITGHGGDAQHRGHLQPAVATVPEEPFVLRRPRPGQAIRGLYPAAPPRGSSPATPGSPRRSGRPARRPGRRRCPSTCRT